jgi:hypothetical protein
MPRKAKLLIGKRNDHVATPKALLEVLTNIHKFDFDPCPLHHTVDGLHPTTEWGKSNFVNPPYSNIEKWVMRGVQEMHKGNKSVFLITARTNTGYWCEHVFPNAHQILFFNKRVKFEGQDFKDTFPIPLALVTFDPVLFTTEDRTYNFMQTFIGDYPVTGWSKT